MKRNIAFICGLLLCLAAQAQVTWNMKGGAGLAVSLTNANVDPKPKFVAKLGVGIETPLSPDLSLMPSFEFALKGGKYDSVEFQKEGGSETLNLTYLQIPVLLAYRLNLGGFNNITLKAGPYFAYALSGKVKAQFANISGGSLDYEVNIFDKDELEQVNADSSITPSVAKRLDVGIDAGIDFEFRRFVAGLEYEVGFVSMAPNGANMKNQAFYLTVGYKF